MGTDVRPARRTAAAMMAAVRTLSTALAASALLLIAPAGAAAAVEVGNTCAAEESDAGLTAVALTKSDSTVPLAVPSSGVITAWRLRVGPGEALFAQQLRVLRETKAAPYEFTTVVESKLESPVAGLNTFAARLPVKADDRLGLFGPTETYLCAKAATDTGASFGAPAPVGTTNTFTFVDDLGVPATAIVEPDRDGDGFGDETQDLCPQSGGYQSECPTATVKRKAVVRKRAILVQVQVSSEARVQVFGQVSWRVRGQVKEAQRAKEHRLSVGLSAGRPRVLLPGTTAIFRVPLTKPVKRRLGRLEPSESLRPKMTVRVTDLAGRIRDHRFRLRLQGRG